MTSWQDRAAAKRAQLHASIPSDWLLPASVLAAPPSDVRSIPRSSGLLTDLELQITEEDSAGVILEKIRSREWSSEQVTLAFCKRAAIAQQLTCCLTETLFDRALKRAKELDEHLDVTGEVIGPLHGLPISLKEQFDIEGVESTMGFVSRIGHVSSSSAVIVSLLESLGAIPHCRTNIPQTLLSDESTNNVFGQTLNPSNLSLTAGGSSGGEAALIAMRGSPLGVGTDLGGSIRKPASFTGLYSLRPTSRRLPYAGASNIFAGAEALESVLGPMANSLESLEVFMKAVVGAKPWEWDSRVVEREWKEERREGPKCFAVMRWDGLVRCHPPIERALDEIADALRKEGHEVIEWEPIDHAGAQEIVSKIFDSDGGEDVKQWLGDSGEPIMPQVFTSQHPAMSIHESWQLNKKRDEYRQLFLNTWLATSASTQTGRPIDAIICATAPHLAAPHLESPRPGGLITYTTVWSLLDLPCYTVPVGVVDEQKDPKPIAGAYTPISDVDKENWEGYSPELYKNAPVVLQVINPRRFREDELLGLGRDIEKALRT